jgi:hypothetical protein
VPTWGLNSVRRDQRAALRQRLPIESRENRLLFDSFQNSVFPSARIKLRPCLFQVIAAFPVFRNDREPVRDAHRFHANTIT